MPSCEWCGQRAVCPQCVKAAALRGGAAACGVCAHLGFPCSKHRALSHPLPGIDEAPESTAIEKIEAPEDKATGTTRRKPRLEGHDHPPPPSAGAYSQGCREPECRAANTAYRRERRRARGAQERQYRGHTHGRASTYNHGCRCEPCRGAHAAAVRRFRASKRRLEAPRIPSKPPKAPPMGDDSGQIGAQDGKMGK